MTRDGKTGLFSFLLREDRMRDNPTIFNNVKAIEGNLKVLKEYYNRISFSKGNGLILLYILICCAIFILIASCMAVFAVEWWGKNKSSIS